MLEHTWVEVYRPRTVADTILPSDLKARFQSFVDNGELPNLMLTGHGGVGKTTIARAICEELDCDYIIIRGSEEGRLIDTLRNKIRNFASSVSFKKKKKFVIIDEADYTNPETVQPALRGFIEEFSSNCGFIFTCNFPHKIMEQIHSRCTVIDFKISKEESPKLAAQFFKRCIHILDENKITYDKKVIVEVVTKYFPDNRRILNELQGYSASGTIDSGILKRFSDVQLDELMVSLKNKNFEEVRKWVALNIDTDSSRIIRKIFDTAINYLKKDSVAETVLILGEYQYKAAFVADQEINMVAMLTEMMKFCEWK